MTKKIENDITSKAQAEIEKRVLSPKNVSHKSIQQIYSSKAEG